MKIAIVNTWSGGAVHNIMFPLANALRKDGHEVDYVTVRQVELDPSFDRSFGEYDIVHFGYFANIARFIQDIEVPFTAGVHHIPPHRLDAYTAQIRAWSPRMIVCPEPFPRRQLAQMGILNTTQIPYAFDHSKFRVLSFPKEFTIGYLGCDYESKRFHIIEQAAKQAEVPFVGLGRKTLNEEEGYLDDSQIQAFYKAISCYVVAGFNEGGPLPPQEALLSGRPVITTEVGMMPQIIVPYKNGLFYNGSVAELVPQIHEIKSNLEHYHYGAKLSKDQLPPVKAVAYLYERMFEKVLGDEG